MSPQFYHTSVETTQQPTLFDAPPNIAGAAWLGFTADHPEDDAAALFLRRYGQPPGHILRGLGGILLVGPVPGMKGSLP